jgi:hypothetical protein
MSVQTVNEETILVSEHALDRWDERTDPTSVAPETAWKHGQRVAVTAPFQAVDEVRYHRASGTLLLYRAPTINTVYDVDELSGRAYHAVKHALPEDHE